MRIIILFAALMFSLALETRAQSTADTPDEARPHKELSFDLSHRMRFVSWDAGMKIVGGSPVSFTRNRTRIGGTWRPLPSLELRATLTNEFFHWIDYPVEREFNLDEVIFEHLYVRWRNDALLPVDVTVGRFDMPLGEGFVIMDGTPLDGSRTLYMNGVRAVVEPAEGHSATLFYVHQPTRDKLLPVFNDRDRPLSEEDRSVAGMYYTGMWDRIDWDLYALHVQSRDSAVISHSGVEDLKGLSEFTFGARVAAELLPGVSATLEAALQRGELRVRARPSLDRKAWAAHGNLSWDLRPGLELPVLLRAGMYHYSYEMLSIPSEGSGTYGWLFLIGQWDPVLGRWPKWSESLVFTEGILLRPAYWSIVQAPFAEVSVTPHSDWVIRSSIQTLKRAKEFGPDQRVGTLLTAHLFWKPDLPFSGHAMLERMWYDGDFRAEAPSYLWARLELMYRVEW
jgi:hypothetical protein